jgi:outer membrane protein, heavy metal efflux system
MRRILILIIGLFLVAGITGCASFSTTANRPEPRPLGKLVPTFQAEVLSASEQQKRMAKEPGEDLTLQEALALALLQNPELAVFSYEIRIREAYALQASLFPNPELGIELENVGGSRGLRGFNATETTLQIGQLIELGGKRIKRIRLAALESDLVAWDYEVIRLNVFMKVVKAFTDVLAAQKRVTLNEELVRITEQFWDSINRRVEAGRTSPAEASRAKVELLSAKIELERSKLELQTLRKRLAATWGSIEVSFAQVIGDLESVFTPPGLTRIKSFLKQNPDIARWTAELAQRGAVLSLEKAMRIPDPIVTGGVRRFNETDDNAFVVGLSIPLPVFNRNQGAIEVAEYRRRQAKYQKKSIEVALQIQLAETYNALSAAYNEVNVLKTDMLPEAEKAFETIRQGFQMGRFGFMDLLDAQRTLFGVRSRFLDMLREYQQALADIERLIGQSLNDF